MSLSMNPIQPRNSVAYINASIYTVNTAQPWAEGFIVSPNGTFTSVGHNEDIQSTAKEEDLIVVNLQGRFIMPGIHDSHVHTFHSGLHLLSDILMDFDTNSSTLGNRLESGFGGCAYHNTYSDWVIGVLDEVEDYDRSLLDSDWPSNPVLIHGAGGHVKYLNTLGLQEAGFDIESEPDANRSIFVRREDGSLTGEIGGQAAMGRANMAVPRPALAQVKRGLKRAVMELHRSGVTSCQEAAANTLLLEALQELDHDNQLHMDYSTHILYKNEWLSGEILKDPEQLIQDAHKYASDHVDTRFIKFMMDGVPLGPETTYAGINENGEPDTTKILQTDLAELVGKWDAKGMSSKVHCIGQGAVKLALDAFSQVRRKNPNGPRHEIAHCAGVRQDDFSRFRELNVTAEMSPAMHFTTKFPDDQLGWNFTGMVESNNLVTIGSDWAFGMRLSLFPSVAHLVEKIGAEAILEMLTLNGARSVGKDHKFGSISVGKMANFISVDRDLTLGGFENATVTQTWFEGNIVYDALGIFLPN